MGTAHRDVWRARRAAGARARPRPGPCRRRRLRQAEEAVEAAQRDAQLRHGLHAAHEVGAHVQLRQAQQRQREDDRGHVQAALLCAYLPGGTRVSHGFDIGVGSGVRGSAHTQSDGVRD